MWKELTTEKNSAQPSAAQSRRGFLGCPGSPSACSAPSWERIQFALGTGVSTHYGQASCSSTASECYRKGNPISTITDCSNHFWHFSLDYRSINSAPCLACQVALLSIWMGKQPRTPHFKCQISAKSQQHKCNWHLTHRAPSSGHSSTTLPQQRAHIINSHGSGDTLTNARFILQTGASVRFLKAPATFSAKLVRCWWLVTWWTPLPSSPWNGLWLRIASQSQLERGTADTALN